MVTFTSVNEALFLNKNYPVNGQRSVKYTASETTEHRIKSFVIVTSIMWVVFLILAIVMFVLHKKDAGSDVADRNLRESIVDLQVDVFDKEAAQL